MSDTNLYISGGGESEDSLLLDKNFLERIDKKGSILYIPIAMEADYLGFESCYDWITKTLSSISEDFIDITMWTDLRDKSWDDIKDFTAIYIGGGNTFKLLNNFFYTSFIVALKKYISNGGIVYGGSAGAIIMGKSINTVKEENDKNYKENKGLNLFSGSSIICHYENKMDAKIINYATENHEGVIALSERTGLFLFNSEILVIGYEPAYYFDLNGKIKILEIDKKYFYDEKKEKICNL